MVVNPACGQLNRDFFLPFYPRSRLTSLADAKSLAQMREDRNMVVVIAFPGVSILREKSSSSSYNCTSLASSGTSCNRAMGAEKQQVEVEYGRVYALWPVKRPSCKFLFGANSLRVRATRGSTAFVQSEMKLCKKILQPLTPPKKTRKFILTSSIAVDYSTRM